MLALLPYFVILALGMVLAFAEKALEVSVVHERLPLITGLLHLLSEHLKLMCYAPLD